MKTDLAVVRLLFRSAVWGHAALPHSAEWRGTSRTARVSRGDDVQRCAWGRRSTGQAQYGGRHSTYLSCRNYTNEDVAPSSDRNRSVIGVRL